MPYIHVPPLSDEALRKNRRMAPLMRFLAPKGESPQETHRWNNFKFTGNDIPEFDEKLLLEIPGDPLAPPRWLGKIPRFHLGRLGGWQKVAVIRPAINCSKWHVGWHAEDVTGVSQLPLSGSVRVLIGPGAVKFFGVDGWGMQIPLDLVGYGRLGDGGPYRCIRLL